MMLTRRSAGRRPKITFTADFHELVHGDLIPGPCRFRYDPFRIIPQYDYANPQPIKYHVRFHPSGGEWEQEGTCPPGVLKPYLLDVAGQGFMLESSFPMPNGCEELEFWFSYVDSKGQTLWDSAGGSNYRLRFPTHDLALERAQIGTPPNSAVDKLEVELTSLGVVQSVTLRSRLTQPAGQPRKETELVKSSAPGGRTAWITPDGGIDVPFGSTAVFDLVYTVSGRKFTDDNEGTWYLAERVITPNK